MTKVFCCKDLGIMCDWEGSAETKEELLEKVAEHARTAHDMKEMTDSIRLKIIAKMRDKD